VRRVELLVSSPTPLCATFIHLLVKVLIGQEQDSATIGHDTLDAPKGQLNVRQENDMLVAPGIRAGGNRDDVGERVGAERL